MVLWSASFVVSWWCHVNFPPDSMSIYKLGQVLSASCIITDKDTASKMLPYTFSKSLSTVYVYIHIHANLTLSLEIT